MHEEGKLISLVLRRIGYRKRWLALIAVLLALSGSSAWAQEPPQEPWLFLQKHPAFSRDQLVQVKRGAAVAKVLKPHKHEVAAVVATRVNVPQDFFVASLRDIEKHKKSKSVTLVRKFSDPARLDDLRDLTLLPQEIRDLKNCKPGKCNFKLSNQQIERMHREVDWTAPVAAEQATAAFRRILLDYVLSYAAQGNKAMLVYHDKQAALETATQFIQLVEGSPFLQEYAPEFREHLQNFSEPVPPDVEDFLYWSRETYGHDLKGVITITHVIIYRRRGETAPATLIASKQVYASHYFQDSLGLTLLFRAEPSDPDPSFYLVYLNRSRIDLLRKWYSGLARGTLSDNVRNSMRTNMLETKKRLETEYAATQARGYAPGLNGMLYLLSFR